MKNYSAKKFLLSTVFCRSGTGVTQKLTAFVAQPVYGARRNAVMRGRFVDTDSLGPVEKNAPQTRIRNGVDGLHQQEPCVLRLMRRHKLGTFLFDVSENLSRPERAAASPGATAGPPAEAPVPAAEAIGSVVLVFERIGSEPADQYERRLMQEVVGEAGVDGKTLEDAGRPPSGGCFDAGWTTIANARSQRSFAEVYRRMSRNDWCSPAKSAGGQSKQCPVPMSASLSRTAQR